VTGIQNAPGPADVMIAQTRIPFYNDQYQLTFTGCASAPRDIEFRVAAMAAAAPMAAPLSRMMIVAPDGGIGVIDFNSYNLSYGDPWWELAVIPWGQEPCGPYFSGLIHGYFDGRPPAEYFALLRYYLAYDGLAALCDTDAGEQGTPEEGRRHAENVLQWLDDFNSPIPAWYRGGLEP